MTNPWADVIEDDYLGHMNSPAVGQRPVLGRVLGEVLRDVRPRAVLFLGGATGNGLEHVDAAVTSRVSVIDINPAFVRSLQERLPQLPFALDIRCADVADVALEPGAYDLVHAALVLEYVDWRALLPGLASALAPGGTLSVVLQVPSATSPAVTPTPFTRLLALESVFHFVDPAALVDAAQAVGLDVAARRSEPLPAGKAFEILRFARRQA